MKAYFRYLQMLGMRQMLVTANLRYATNQMLRGILKFDLAYMVKKSMNIIRPTNWARFVGPLGVVDIDITCQWPVYGIIHMYTSGSAQSEAEVTNRFLEHYNTFMEVNRFGAKRLF